MEKYFGGTGITLEKLKKVMPTMNVDGTTYKIEDWLKECAVFDALVPGKSKVWIPYNVWEQGIVSEVVQNRYNFGSYNWPDEMKDWWVAEPMVKANFNSIEWYVYVITFYKNWRRKSQMKHLTAQREKPKRKFLSQKDMADIKKQTANKK